MALVQEIYDYRPFSATGNLSPGARNLAGILVSASTGGTITVYDAALAETDKLVVATMAVAAGVYYPIPAGLNRGLYIVVGGTLTATAFFS